MASVHLRRGKWQVKYRDPNGAQRSRTFSQRRDADKFRGQVEVAMERGEWTDPNAGKQAFVTLVEEWYESKAHLRSGTRSNYRSVLDRWVIPAFGDAQVARITPSDIRRWVARARVDGIGETQLVKAYGVLQQIFDQCVESKLIPSNPVPQRDRPRRPEVPERRFLTAGEIETLADAIEPRFEALVLFLGWTGLRFGEAAGLRPERLDLLRRQVDVVEQVTETRGKLEVGPLKTRQARRRVELPRLVAPKLTEHLGQFSNESWVFPAQEGGPIRRSHFLRNVWPTATRRAGLEGVTPHDLRHSHCALAIAAGANVLALSRRLGHSNVSFTLQKYGHLFPNADSEITAALDRLHAATLDQEPPARIAALSRGSVPPMFPNR